MGIESCMYIGSVDGEEEIGDDGRPRSVFVIVCGRLGGLEREKATRPRLKVCSRVHWRGTVAVRMMWRLAWGLLVATAKRQPLLTASCPR